LDIFGTKALGNLRNEDIDTFGRRVTRTRLLEKEKNEMLTIVGIGTIIMMFARNTRRCYQRLEWQRITNSIELRVTQDGLPDIPYIDPRTPFRVPHLEAEFLALGVKVL
jgi:hypothetical protein